MRYNVIADLSIIRTVFAQQQNTQPEIYFPWRWFDFEVYITMKHYTERKLEIR